MIFYGDPALAPFARDGEAPGLGGGDGASAEGLHLRLEVRPQLDGTPGVDFMLPQSRLTDYYSVKTADYAKELALEVYRVVPLPAGCKGAPRAAGGVGTERRRGGSHPVAPGRGGGDAGRQVPARPRAACGPRRWTPRAYSA